MYNLLNYQTLEVLDRMKLVKEFYDEGSFRIVGFMGKWVWTMTTLNCIAGSLWMK